ncbi:MAG: NAD(P)-dependent oxidoreductase [Phycisphaerales bacterium]|nr:NAD(P)-dependent oxidoreductase [Phycisphaerales bacterium]
MKVLVTGAAGYLGRGLVVPFERGGCSLRLMDVATPPPSLPSLESRHEVVVGDVADLEAVRVAVRGVDGIVIAHMAPREPNSYAVPTLPFDVNVKGTANLFHAAVENGVKRVVLISSTAAPIAHGKSEHGQDVPHTALPKSRGMYGLTKALQEIIAEQYAREHGMGVAALRVGWVMDQDSLVNKYGTRVTRYSTMLTDRRDIGEVARLWLEHSALGYEVFNVMSTSESMVASDVQHTCDFLGWRPGYPFDNLPRG